jgi:hypothetical protein
MFVSELRCSEANNLYYESMARFLSSSIKNYVHVWLRTA